MFELHEKIVATGYSGVLVEGWPDWLARGTHSVTHIKASTFGVLIKTNKQFTLVPLKDKIGRIVRVSGKAQTKRRYDWVNADFFGRL